MKSPTISKASQPSQTGVTVPANITPHISFQQSMDAAATKIDALLRGGVECITYISSAILVGYLATVTGSGKGRKISVMRDEFELALKKKGLGGTQTKKYLDYGQKISAMMYKECSFGMEMAALIAADTPDKAHIAVVAWLSRHTKGKKTEHGFKLDEATVKLNVLGIYLGAEVDPSKPETLDSKTDAQKQDARRVTQAKAIEADPAILNKVPADKLLSTLNTVISFSVLVGKHVETMTEAKALKKERDQIVKAYDDRIKALSKPMGKKADEPVKAAASGTVTSEAA